jgi:hypothetical protein
MLARSLAALCRLQYGRGLRGWSRHEVAPHSGVNIEEAEAKITQQCGGTLIGPGSIGAIRLRREGESRAALV